MGLSPFGGIRFDAFGGISQKMPSKASDSSLMA
jgi:hypothetical protein